MTPDPPKPTHLQAILRLIMLSKLSEYKERATLKQLAEDLTFEYQSEYDFIQSLLTQLETLKPSLEKDLLKVTIKL